MTYKTHEIITLASARPNVHAQALKQGKLSHYNTRITLPDDFDFNGTPPIHIPPMPREPAAPSPRGLGDIIAAFAQPISHLLDRLLGTRLARCSGCQRRRRFLNHLLPFRRR